MFKYSMNVLMKWKNICIHEVKTKIQGPVATPMGVGMGEGGEAVENNNKKYPDAR